MTNELIQFNEDQVRLIKSQIAPEATKDELGLFLYQAKRTGLDPLTRQIYCIHRNTKNPQGNWIKKMTIQTSIDGFRVIAERSGDYAGQDEPVFIEENGKLISCKITVYRFRDNVRYPAAVGLAYWSEYCQENSPMWKKMPHTMLAKVAEALALRKAYPQDLSGLYTNEEMAQSDELKQPVDVTPASPASKFFKEPSGEFAGLAEQANDDIKLAAEEERLSKLKTALESFGSIAEIDGYLEGTFKGKTRLQVLESMSEVNAAQAKMIIANAKLAIDPDGNHNS